MNSKVEVLQCLLDAKHIVLCRHVNPDGDCLGAQLGLGIALQRMGKQVDMIRQDDIPKHLSYLPHLDQLAEPNFTKRYDLFIMVDLGDIPRLGACAELMKNATNTLCIDHHRTTQDPCAINYVKKNASSTCEIIAELLLDSEIVLDSETATLLYAGIITDSNRFLYDNARSQTMRIGADLLDLGARSDWIYFHEYQNLDPKLYFYQAEVIRNATFLYDGKIVLAECSVESLDRYGLDVDVAETVVGIMKNFSGVELAVLIKEREPFVQKVSFRSKQVVDVSELASEFGGGGHIKAAGATLKMTLQEARKLLRQRLEKLTWEN